MITRRHALTLISTSAVLPSAAFAARAREIMWEELIPQGVPYSEIIGEGEIDYENDTWNPVYDANGVKLNEDLNDTLIKMPGFIVPLAFEGTGVTDFLLVPYVGACVHTPPPPANQLVFVTTSDPWSSDSLWDAVWVTGTMRTQLQSTERGQTGYAITAQNIELYVW